MEEKIQLRRDTLTNWTSSNAVLSQGELGIVTDTGDIKLGDGTTPWNSLAPWSPSTINGASKLVSIAVQGFGTSLNFSSSTAAGTGEMIFTVGVAATDITAAWNHFYTTTTGAIPDTDPGGSIVFNASLKVISSTNPGTVTGTLYRLTFGGRSSVTLDPGGRIVADPLGLSLAPGDVVAVRTHVTSGTTYAPRTTYGTYGSNLGGFVGGSDLTVPGSGAVTAATGNIYGPATLLGYPTGPASAKSVLVVGDSIGYGLGDYALASNPSLGDQAGFVQRALAGVAGVVNIAVQSDAAQYFLSTTGSFRRLPAAQRCNSAIIEYGTNDRNLGYTAAQIETANLNIASYLLRLGIGKVVLTTLTPQATSTDAWATTANQTVTATESIRVAYNTWIRAGCPIDPSTKAPVAVGTSGALLAGQYGHPITTFIDVAAQVESSLNSGKWLPANRVATGSITSGTSALTSSTANFQSANQEAGGDTGSAIALVGAGVAGANLVGYINSVGSSTAATLDSVIAVAAGTTVTNATLVVGPMTVDGLHPSPRGYYLISQAINTALL